MNPKLIILIARYKKLSRNFDNHKLAAKVARKIRALGGEVPEIGKTA